VFLMDEELRGSIALKANARGEGFRLDIAFAQPALQLVTACASARSAGLERLPQRCLAECV
jgi:hypothetical protein